MTATPAAAAADDTALPPPRLRLLVICTGNICRSPAAERLLAAGLGGDGSATVGSAGTRAVVGKPVSAPMVPLMTAAGASAEHFAARQLTERMLREADLVLTMTQDHRAEVVSRVPSMVRRTFTLREIARLAAEVDPDVLPAGTAAERLYALVPLAAARRGRTAVGPAEDDVIDPYRQSDAVYARSFGQLQMAVDTLIRLVMSGGDRSASAPGATA